MKARIIRLIFATHRWAGVVLGLLMLLWCVSGVVMIWSPYPSMREGARDLRVEGLKPISLPELVIWPAAPPPGAVPSSARIEMLADRPVLNVSLRTESGGSRKLFDLVTGEPYNGGMTEGQVLAVARIYAERHALPATPSIKALMTGKADRDEFTVSGEFNSGRPLYQVRLNDPSGTMLYITSRTGEVLQRTTAASRFWTWTGAIPHWLYFTELRRNGKLWNDVVVWTSLAGTFLTVIGLFVGIRQFRRRHSTGKRASPYRGAKFWHHMLGLTFGVLVLTFVFSGFASMNPFGWLESGPGIGDRVGRLSGPPVTWQRMADAFLPQVEALRRGEAEETAQLTFSRFDGQPYIIAHRANGARQRFGEDGKPALFDEGQQTRAGVLIAGEGEPSKVELIEKPDAYYYPGDPAEQAAVRITLPDAQDTRFYLDPISADVRTVADPGSRDFRWWHSALHTFDVIGSPLREALVFLAMLGVTAVCALGSWLGIKKLARGGKLDNLPEDEPAPPAS